MAYCPNEYGLIYLKRRICDYCWDELAAEDDREVLYEALNVPKSLRFVKSNDTKAKDE